MKKLEQNIKKIERKCTNYIDIFNFLRLIFLDAIKLNIIHIYKHNDFFLNFFL